MLELLPRILLQQKSECRKANNIAAQWERCEFFVLLGLTYCILYEAFQLLSTLR